MLDLYWGSAFLVIAFIGSFLLFKSRNEIAEYPEEDREFKYTGMVFSGFTIGLIFLWERLDASLLAWVHQVIPYAAEQPELHQLTYWAALVFMYFGSMMCLVMTPVFLGHLYDNKVAVKC